MFLLQIQGGLIYHVHLKECRFEAIAMWFGAVTPPPTSTRESGQDGGAGLNDHRPSLLKPGSKERTELKREILSPGLLSSKQHTHP
jgi:hypothetical protein